MKKSKKFIGVAACAFLYSSMFLLPYIKYIFYDACLEATGFTHTQLGMLLTVFMVSLMIWQLPSGWIADRFHPRKMIILSGLGHAALSFLALVFIRNFAATVVIYFCLGITSILFFYSPVFKAIGLLGSEEEQGKLYGWFEGFNGLGSMIFNFLALWVYSRITGGSVAALKGVYIMYACASLVGTLLVFFLYKPELDKVAEMPKEPVKKVSIKEVLTVFKKPRVWLFSLMVLGGYGFFAGSSYLTPYFSTVLGVSVAFSGGLATLKSYGTRFVGAPVMGIVADKFGRIKSLQGGFLICVLLMVVFILLPASPSVLIPIMVLMFAMALVNNGLRGIWWSALGEIGVDERIKGTAIAIGTQIGYNIPDLVIHPIFGAILDKYEAVTAYKIIFATLLGLLAMGFILSCVLGVLKKKDARIKAEAV